MQLIIYLYVLIAFIINIFDIMIIFLTVHIYIHFALSVPPECHIVCFSLVQTDHPAQQPTEYWLHMNFLPAHTL